MAIVKLNSVIKKITGSLGQITYTSKNDRTIAKKKQSYTYTGTSGQLYRRDYFKTVARLWNYVAPIVQQTYYGSIEKYNKNQYNFFLENNINKIKNDSCAEIAIYGNMSELTKLEATRDFYSTLTFIYYNVGDISGTETINIILYTVGDYGETTNIRSWTRTVADTSPITVKGLDEDKEYFVIGYKLNNSFVTADNYSPQRITKQERPKMTVPIGTINYWHKSLEGCPELPADWAECNGQILVDPDSPFNGKTLPNLNTSVYGFLRGAPQSGDQYESKTYTDAVGVNIYDFHYHGRGTITAAAHAVHAHAVQTPNGIEITDHAGHIHGITGEETETEGFHVHPINHTHDEHNTAYNESGHNDTEHQLHAHLDYGSVGGVDGTIMVGGVANITTKAGVASSLHAHEQHYHLMRTPAYYGDSDHSTPGHKHIINGNTDNNQIQTHQISGHTNNNSATQTHVMSGVTSYKSGSMAITLTGDDETTPNYTEMVAIIRIK